MIHSVYILYSEKLDRYYIGMTQDTDMRLHRHNNGATKSTKGGRPWRIVYKEDFETRPLALQREREIKKKKSRRYVEWLIQQKLE